MNLSQKQIEAARDSLLDAMFITNMDGEFEFVNQSVADLTGHSKEALLEMNPLELSPPEDHEIARNAIEQSLANERWTSQFRLLGKDGESHHFEFRTTRLTDEDGDPVGVVGIGVDITDQRAQQRELEESQERLELVQKGAHIAVWDWNPKTGEAFIDENYAKMLGYDPHEIEQHEDAWENRVHPDDYDAVWDSLTTHFEGNSPYYESEHRLETKAGDWVWSRDVGKVFERDEQGDPVRMVGVHLDIDQKKRYELALESQRDQLSILNQIVRHDIRNDMQVVLGMGKRLSKRVEGEDSEAVDRLLSSARHVVELTTTMRDLTDVMLEQEFETRSVRINHVIESEIDVLQATTESAIIQTEGPPPHVSVHGDELLNAVFRNILRNAIQHNDAVVPKVVVECEVGHEVVQVRISDNGPGIADEQKEVVFGRGEKGLESSGTGLGLYLVDQLIRSYGGRVWAVDTDSASDSKTRSDTSDHGVTFVVELLRSDS